MSRKLLVILAIYISLVIFVIRITPSSSALIHDASGYYELGKSMLQQGIAKSFFSPDASFTDKGYPTVIALIMSIVGTDNIVALQVANYLFWGLASWLLYLSLLNLGEKKAKLWGLIMLFSPLFLSFSAKLYSESFAALGTALLMYGMVKIKKDNSIRVNIVLVLGGIILFSTKSVFLLFIPVILAILLFWRQYLSAIWFLIVPLILFPSILSSGEGGRSSYNLAIQVSKAEQSYDEILACIPYYLSYPLGQKLLPSYQGVCHQNDPVPTMPRYGENPYVQAFAKRDDHFTLTKWLGTIATHPLKYTLIVFVSMANIVFVEGIYPSILLQLPTTTMFLGYLFAKIILSIYLWFRVFANSRLRSWAWLLPIIYFVVVVGNFPIEPRYFYPLLPYLYFLAAWQPTKDSKNKSGNHQSA